MTDNQRLGRIENRIEVMFWCLHHLVGHDVFMRCMNQVIADNQENAEEAEFQGIIRDLDDIPDPADIKETNPDD